MITLKDFMEVTGYRITEGSDYGWTCYGNNAYTLDSWNGDQNGFTASIIFDTRTQVVYEASAYDYKRERAYKIINPLFAKAHKKESKRRGVDKDEAWDGVKYVTLETDEDFLSKVTSIFADEDYDTRVEVPLTLDRDQIFDLMAIAHSRDITLNHLVEDLLKQYIVLKDYEC